MIGVNNVVASPSHSAQDIAHGISAIVARLREKLPNTQILLLGTFPKDRAPNTPDRRKIQELNSITANLNDGKWIRFLDIGGQFLDKDGNLNADVSPDGVHLTMKGYQLWAEAIGPFLQQLRAQEPPSNGVSSLTSIPPKAIETKQNGKAAQHAAPLGDSRFLTTESLAMPRRQISLKGTDLRLFNARGSLTFRERTVTGIAELFIAPRAASRVPVSFNLSFREETLGALIEDNQDEWGEGTLNVWQH
jgi:hypothetical protein